MKKYLLFIFMLLVGMSMISCGDDSGFNVIDIGDDDDDEVEGTVYSITFNVDGSSDTFTFSVDMADAVIDAEDLPEDFEGTQFVFNPDEHDVFVAGGLPGDIEWNQPGTNSSLRMTRAGRTGGTINEGSVPFKFFIVFDGMDFEANDGWNYGEWEGEPNRSVDVVAGGDLLVVWGVQPDVEPPTTPAKIFMIGDALNMEDSDADGTADGWQWDLTDAPMVPVNGKEMFWKIVWLIEGGEFKFAPQRAWENDFGSDGVDPADEIYAMGGSNLTVPGATGYYMVVVNFETEEVSVTAPQVYLIGDTIGSWDTANADALFTVDNANEVITITKDLLAANLRMYAWFDKGWFTDWWQSEFMIFDGLIEFRGEGDDQAAVGIDPAGEYMIDLNFRTGEGSIEAQ